MLQVSKEARARSRILPAVFVAKALLQIIEIDKIKHTSGFASTSLSSPVWIRYVKFTIDLDTKPKKIG